MNTENIEDIYELSPVQQGILFHSLYEPELGIYVIQMSYTLRGNLNIAAFAEAWQQVATRHTVLRTVFYWQDIDKPLQIVRRQVRIPLEQQDWRLIDTATQQEKFEAFVKSDRLRGFDLWEGPLMRLSLLRLTDDIYQFIWSTHHLILDGWSTPLLFQEVIELYGGLCQGREVNLGVGTAFADYIDWLQHQDVSQAEAFWRQTLQGVRSPTPLTNLETRNLSSQKEICDDLRISLSSATTAGLISLARQHHITQNTLFQGAWAILLSRYSCQKNVVYGCTVAGRPIDLPRTESILGTFINTLPVRIQVNPDQFLLPWLHQLQAQLVEMRQYEYSPLPQVQGWSEIPRGTPLFNSIVVFENYPRGYKNLPENLEVDSVRDFYKTNYPLTIIAIPDVELRMSLSFDVRRFDSITITAILADFQNLFQSMVDNPNVRIQDLQFFTPEQQQIRAFLEKQATFNYV